MKKRKQQPARIGRESLVQRKKRAAAITKRLRRQYEDADCALQHRSALQLLVSTILSAQCTDQRVNKVTPSVFAKYRNAKDFASADPAEMEALIQSTGFFRNKTKSIIGAGRVISERFGGEVPDTMEQLLELPGVARKTANVVLGNAFGINVGVVVDTHVIRLSRRFGLSRHTDPKKIERDLMALFPRPHWTMLAHMLIFHGRRVCKARGALCAEHPLCRRYCSNAPRS